MTTSPRSGLGGIKSVGHLNEFECGDDGCMGVLVELERGVVVATGGLEVVAGEDVVVAATGLVAGGPTAAGSSGAVELCALKWEDLDFQTGRICIERAVTKDEDGQAITGPPKTSKSRRTIPMFGLQDVLLEHYKWQAEHGLDASGYVFTNQDGAQLKPWSFNRRELERVTGAAGIEGSFTLYSFRHRFATLHLASGTPLKIVSEWLGHATIQQTANTYMHVSSDVSDDYAERHLAWLAEAGKAAEGTAPN